MLLVAFLAIVVGAALGCTVAFGLGVSDTEDMTKPELIDSGWLGPRTKWIAPVMVSASVLSARSSASKRPCPMDRVPWDKPAFPTHVKLKHSEEFKLADIAATKRTRPWDMTNRICDRYFPQRRLTIKEELLRMIEPSRMGKQ